MKKYFCFLFLCCLIFLPLKKSLAYINTSDLINNSTAIDTKVYNKDFDILVMDFTIPGGENDKLEAMTFSNDGTANYDDLDKVIIWKDVGEIGFQGYMKDVILGEAIKTDSKSWIISGLDEELGQDGLRIFVSVETKNSITTGKRIQFVLDGYSDISGNDIYDFGDKGIYFESGNNGPIDSSLMSNYSFRLENRGGDSLPPKIPIINLNNNDIIELSDSNFLIEGDSRDRMSESVKYIRVSYKKIQDTTSDVWNDVTISNVDSSWNYNLENITPGDYLIKIWASDWSGNMFLSDPLSVQFTEEVVGEVSDPDTENVNNQEEENQGPVCEEQLIKSISYPNVYLLKTDCKKYWFPNETIFNSYYQDFSELSILPDDEVDGYQDSGNVQIKSGSLIKSLDNPKVYVVGENWQITWIETEEEANRLYGESWNKIIKIIPDEFFLDYIIH